MSEVEPFPQTVSQGHELLLRGGRQADIRSIARLMLQSQLEDKDQLSLIDKIARNDLFNKDRSIISHLGHVVDTVNDRDLIDAISPFLGRREAELDDKLKQQVPRLNKYIADRPDMLVATHKEHGQDVAHIVSRVDFVSSHKHASSLGLFDGRGQHIDKIGSVLCVIPKFTPKEQDYLWANLD